MFQHLILWWCLWRQPAMPMDSEPDLDDDVLSDELWMDYLERCYEMDAASR